MPNPTDRPPEAAVTNPPLKLRGQDDIAARILAVVDDDQFGFRREVLIRSLDFEHARPMLVDGATAEAWAEQSLTDADAVRAAAFDYYEFALEKIEHHRGISATRSVAKLGEWAWLLCRDDVVAAMEAAPYAQYGAPKLHAFCVGFGLSWPDAEDMVRMADGSPCTPDCDMGCSR